MENPILVSVVMPIFNEEKYIAGCIDSVLQQDFPKDDMELVLVDGGSTDKTLEIIQQYMEKNPHIRLVHNPKRTIQYAMNTGIHAARGEYIVRMDAHAEYARDYVSKCIEVSKRTGAENVGGPVITRGKNPVQKVVAAAFHSRFALGGGKNHEEGYEGYADTVFSGTYKKEYIQKLGMYDERFPCNEDDELNFRISESGGKIYISSAIKSIYYPRDTYTGLFKQYLRYGIWKIAVIKKHHRPARISHMVPLAFVLFLLLFGIASCFSKLALGVFLGVLLLYIVLDGYFSFTNQYIHHFTDGLRLMWVHFVIHIAYGIGFIVGFFRFLGKKFD